MALDKLSTRVCYASGLCGLCFQRAVLSTASCNSMAGKDSSAQNAICSISAKGLIPSGRECAAQAGYA